MFNNITVM